MLGDPWISVVFLSRALIGVTALGSPRRPGPGMPGARDACLAGGGADVGDRCVAGPGQVTRSPGTHPSSRGPRRLPGLLSKFGMLSTVPIFSPPCGCHGAALGPYDSEWVTMSGEARSKPSAEPVLTVDTREELVYLLGQACEIEHGLMCEYLYAQFSLKRGMDEGLTPGQLARVQAWEAALIGVIKQEMLHLALATNILTAIGMAPHFERPNFPIVSRWYPEGVQIALVPFGERALRHFMYLERPEGMALDDAAGFAAARQAQPLTVGDAH